MSAIKLSAVLIAASVLSGCAGMSEQACLSADWRTVGFEDGSLGRSVATIGTYRQQCAEHGVAPDLDAYRVGHAEGVTVYCRASNGFTVGHSGAAYQGVCPAGSEADFVAAYNSGRHLYELEAALGSIDSRLSSDRYEQQRIKQEITDIAATMVAGDTKPEERVRLVSRTAELGRRYGELNSEIEALGRDRVARERDLLDYQQTLAAGN